MKIVNSSPVTSFGGLNFVIKEAIDLKINKLLNSSLPVLANQSKYTWFDIIMSYWSAFFVEAIVPTPLARDCHIVMPSAYLVLLLEQKTNMRIYGAIAREQCPV